MVEQHLVDKFRSFPGSIMTLMQNVDSTYHHAIFPTGVRKSRMNEVIVSEKKDALTVARTKTTS